MEPVNDNIHKDTIEEWKIFRNRIKDYLIHQTFQEYPGQLTDNCKCFFALTFDELLLDLGLSEQQYMDGLRMYVTSKGPQVFVKRDCRDVFCNNYNPKLLLLHQANLDVSFVTNKYACAAYILGYLTKGEMGIPKLLKALDEEAGKYSWSSDDKLKKFARALDNSREVST